MDEERKENEEFETVEELLEDLQYFDRLVLKDGETYGYKDLKDPTRRCMILGMAEAFMEVQENDLTGEMESTGSKTLDKAREELAESVRREILDALYYRMTEALTTFLDEEGMEDDEQ